jgi:hypothetical protein
VWINLFLILAYLIGIPLGILVFLVVLLILLPIHIGGSGYYRQNEYAVSGWVKALAGVVGVLFDYTERGGQLQVVFGKWVIWQPKEDVEAGEPVLKKDPSPEPIRATPSVGAPSPEPVLKTHTDESVRASLPTPAVKRKKSDTNTSDLPQSSAPPSASMEAGRVPPLKVAGANEKPDATPSLWTRWKALRVRISRYWGYSQEARPILWRFLKRLTRILGFRRVDVDVVYGAGDPALTGRLFGYVEAIRPLLGKRTSLVLTPDFTQSRLEGAGALEVSFYLSRFLLALVVTGGILGVKIWWRERRIKREAMLPEVPSA